MIMDLYDRKVIGWALSKSMKAAETTIPAWQMAIKNRPIERALIFHSGRGVQYACHAFTKLLKKHPLVLQSMSGKGNCWDNAVAESFRFGDPIQKPQVGVGVSAGFSNASHS